MIPILKQPVGIDVSQQELVVSIGRMDMEMEVSIYDYKVFSISLFLFGTHKNTIVSNDVIVSCQLHPIN